MIHWGTYRRWIFESDGAKESFLKCLWEACEACNWKLPAWCLMGNLYPLALETPEGNLVEGMRWWQSTMEAGLALWKKDEAAEAPEGKGAD